MSDAYANAEFGEEIGGYSPREVDKVLKAWASAPPNATEIWDARFGRAVRGYKRRDVDAFLAAMATGDDPSPPSSQLAGFLAQTIAGFAMLAPLVLVFSIPHALRTGSLPSCAVSIAGLSAIALFGWQWRRGPTGAHQRTTA